MRQATMSVVGVVTAILTWGCAKTAPQNVVTPSGSSSSMAVSGTSAALLEEDLYPMMDPSLEAGLVEQSAKKWEEACTSTTIADADAVTLYGKACAANDGDGCAKLGMIYACGTGVQKNPATATALFEKSCTLRSQGGCQMHGGALLGGNFGTANVREGLRVYQSACIDKGSASACGTVGSILMLFGKRDEPQVLRTRAFLEKACTSGSLDSCGNAAVLRRRKRPGVPCPRRDVGRDRSIAGDAFVRKPDDVLTLMDEDTRETDWNRSSSRHET